MSDLASNVTWQEILRETLSGDIPHCRAIACKIEWHQEIIEALARSILKNFKHSHPDLIVIGSSDKAPDIEACRNFINDIALKPVESESKLRLGVIMNADKLNLNAANSLLKLSEEPPEHARLLFLMTDGRLFLPTLKSRSRFNVIISNEILEARKLPVNDYEWIEWLSKTQKADLDEIMKDLEAWRNFETNENNFGSAYIIEKLRIISSKKNLSVPILKDIILMTLKLKEGNLNFEYIFNDLW